jgi:TonB family protein
LFINLTPKVIYAQQELTPQEQAVEDQKSKFVKKYDSADLPSGLQNYILGIQTKVMNHISYPAAVLGTGWEGDLVVRLYLNNAGAINNVVLAKSSGFKIFDDDAVSLVKNLSYPPFPSDVRVEELKVDIPIAYRDKQ